MQLSQSQKIWIVVILAAIAGLIFLTGITFIILVVGGFLYLIYKGIKQKIENPQGGRGAQARYKARITKHPYPKSPMRIMNPGFGGRRRR